MTTPLPHLPPLLQGLQHSAKRALLLAACIGSACAAPDKPVPPPPPAVAAPAAAPTAAPTAAAAAAEAEAWQAVQQQVGDAACDSDAQCRSVGVGHKPCGGPASYLAWSTRGSDAGALNVTVQRHAAIQQAIQQARGRISDCSMIPVPSAVCGPPRAVGAPRSCQLISAPAGSQPLAR